MAQGTSSFRLSLNLETVLGFQGFNASNGHFLEGPTLFVCLFVYSVLNEAKTKIVFGCSWKKKSIWHNHQCSFSFYIETAQMLQL